MIAPWNPEEVDFTKHFTDRIAMSITADNISLTVEKRVEVVNNVINF
jgi:Mg-chelatase subunit ChlI